MGLIKRRRAEAEARRTPVSLEDALAGKGGGITQQRAQEEYARQIKADQRGQMALDAFSRGINMPDVIRENAQNTSNAGAAVSRSAPGAPQMGDDFNALAARYGVQADAAGAAPSTASQQTAQQRAEAAGRIATHYPQPNTMQSALTGGLQSPFGFAALQAAPQLQTAPAPQTAATQGAAKPTQQRKPFTFNQGPFGYRNNR